MREVSVDAHIIAKINNGKSFFYQNELPQSFPSLSPGEWFIIKSDTQSFTAFGNDFVKAGPKVYVLCEGSYQPHDYLNQRLVKAFQKRSHLYQHEGKRLVFGQNDDLPGLIIDLYKKFIIIQINNAGLDQHRNLIKEITIENFKNHKAFFLDNPKYREDESLPVFEKEWNDEEIIEINDSQIIYKLPFYKLQKIGFYYDHRDNRNKFERYLHNIQNKEKALDLFCYLGAWGLHAMRAGSKEITFVDQAALESEVVENTKQIEGKFNIEFKREDVFKFLDNSIKENKKWDVIVCDPPAFCKTIKQKPQAISGYKKLFNKVFKLLLPNSTLVAASCTKYLSLDEFTKIVEMQAKDNGRKITLKDIGMQAQDHPVSSLSDSGNYIKYALYGVE